MSSWWKLGRFFWPICENRQKRRNCVVFSTFRHRSCTCLQTETEKFFVTESRTLKLCKQFRQYRGRRRGIGERKSMKKSSVITIFDMLRQMLSRQYRTKIVRQMRRQIFRQMKQKAEWILDVFTSIFVKCESLFRIWRMQIASSDFLRDEGKNGENPLWIFEYFPEISRKICTQDACGKIRNRLWREICKQMACKVARRSLCGIALKDSSLVQIGLYQSL